MHFVPSLPVTRSSLPVLAGTHVPVELVQTEKWAPARAVAAGLLEVFVILIAPSCWLLTYVQVTTSFGASPIVAVFPLVLVPPLASTQVTLLNANPVGSAPSVIV